jgi:hypothetical protein
MDGGFAMFLQRNQEGEEEECWVRGRQKVRRNETIMLRDTGGTVDSPGAGGFVKGCER